MTHHNSLEFLIAQGNNNQVKLKPVNINLKLCFISKKTGQECFEIRSKEIDLKKKSSAPYETSTNLEGCREKTLFKATKFKMHGIKTMTLISCE